MNYIVTISNVASNGLFSIYTTNGSTFELFESEIPSNVLVQGKIITIPDNTTQIKIVNDSDGCSTEKCIVITNVPPSPTPTPTRTPSTTPVTNETTIPQSWLTELGMSTDPSAREVSLYVTRSEDVELKVTALNGSFISGNGWLNVPWTNDDWQSGTTEYAQPYSEVNRLNGTSVGVGGLTPGTTYKFSFRRVSNKTSIYYINIQIPVVAQGITVINLDGVPGVTPTPTSSPGATPTPTRTPTRTPDVTPTPTQSSITGGGVMTPTVFISGFDEHLQLQITGSSGNWLLTDLSTVTPPPGYNFFYVINGEKIRQSGRLINRPYQSNMPGSIQKLQIKTGAANMNAWGTEGWQDPNLGIGFSMNTSVGIAYISFKLQ